MQRYSTEFKQEALKLSDEIGSTKAASQLGIPYYTLADWRHTRTRKARARSPKPGYEDLESRIQELERENKQLREHADEVDRANEILKDAFRFFVEARKK